MKQPLAGTVATLLICVAALGFISLFPFPVFSGWVAYLLDCIIPMQVIVGVIWGGKQPAFAAKRPQPVRGILLLLLNLAVGVVFAVGLWQWIGHGIADVRFRNLARVGAAQRDFSDAGFLCGILQAVAAC